MSVIEKTNERIEKTNDRIDDKVGKIMGSLDSTKKWVLGLCLATFIGIGAMVLAILANS